MSSRAASTCFGCSFPLDRSFRKTAFRRSVSVSNMQSERNRGAYAYAKAQL
jgi:hypothetical protein